MEFPCVPAVDAMVQGAHGVPSASCQPGWVGGEVSRGEAPREGALQRDPRGGQVPAEGTCPGRQGGVKWAGSGAFEETGGPLVGVQRGVSTRGGGDRGECPSKGSRLLRRLGSCQRASGRVEEDPLRGPVHQVRR